MINDVRIVDDEYVLVVLTDDALELASELARQDAILGEMVSHRAKSGNKVEES